MFLKFRENSYRNPPVKEGERWRRRTNKEIRNIFQGEDVKLIKSLLLRWYGHVERMQNQRIPKQIVTPAVKGTRKRGRLRRRRRGEVEYNGNKNKQAVTRNRREWRTIVLEAKVHNGL
jgi:hypothetical protein